MLTLVRAGPRTKSAISTLACLVHQQVWKVLGSAIAQQHTPFRRPSCQAREEKRKFSPTATSAAVNEVARELLRSARSPKRENGGRRYIKNDGMIASPVGSCLCCWQLPFSQPVPPLYCSAPHSPFLSLRPGLMHSKMWLCELYIICYQF